MPSRPAAINYDVVFMRRTATPAAPRLTTLETSPSVSKDLGDFEHLILLALARLGGDADGGAIRREVERRTGRSVAPGAVYTAMDRLEGRGIVSSRLGDPAPVRGGRRRKHYLLEPEGAKALADAHREYVSLAEGVMPTLMEILQRGRTR